MSIIFNMIFWAVPDFILVLPVMNSGPTIASIGKEAELATDDNQMR